MKNIFSSSPRCETELLRWTFFSHWKPFNRSSLVDVVAIFVVIVVFVVVVSVMMADTMSWNTLD